MTVGGNTTTLAYDYENRITTITYPDSSTNTFTYNGLDTRVGKVDSAGTKTFRRDGVGVTDPVLSDGAASYTPGISERRSGTSKFYHSNHLGTNTAITDASQATTDTRTYDAFGLLTASTGSTPTPFGFAGDHGYQEDADSGLKLLGHRYYDPSTGRFLTRDPIKDGRNWYGYCENNPIASSDPEGLQSIDSLNAALKRAIAGGRRALADLLEIWEESGGVPPKIVDAGRKALEKFDTKAKDWIANKHRGSVNQRFPSHLRERTLEEIRQLAKSGDRDGITAWKLLNDSRFGK